MMPFILLLIIMFIAPLVVLMHTLFYQIPMLWYYKHKIKQKKKTGWAPQPSIYNEIMEDLERMDKKLGGYRND